MTTPESVPFYRCTFYPFYIRVFKPIKKQDRWQRKTGKTFGLYRAETCSLWKCFPIWLEMFWELEREENGTVTIPKLCGYNDKPFTSTFNDSRSSNSNPVMLHDLLSAGLPCTNQTCLEMSLGIIENNKTTFNRVKQSHQGTSYGHASSCTT